MKAFRTILINRNFFLLWISQFLSQIAIHTLNFLIILKIYDYTESVIATSTVWLAYILPAILIGPLAAVYVDLISKKKVLVLTNLIQSAIIFLYAFSYANHIYLSYVVVLLYSFFNQFYIPAEISALPFLVDNKRLPQANGLFLMTYQAALIVGFGLAGLVVNSLGFQPAFLLASLLVFLAFLSVNLLPEIKTKAKLDPKIKGINKFYGEMISGINFIKDNPQVFLAFSTIVGLQALLPIFVVNLPSITKEILKLNPHYAGIITTLPAGIGAAVGILLISRLSQRWRKKEIVKTALTALVAAFWLLVILTPFLSFPYKIIISTILFIILGVSFISIFITAQTHLQILTPKNMMARVFGNLWFLTSIATIVPMFFSAAITEIFGVKLLIIVIGLALLIIRLMYNKITDYNLEILKTWTKTLNQS